MVIALRGNHPPVPTCLVQKIAGRPLAPIHLANAAAQLPYGSGEMQGEGSPLHFSIVATCEKLSSASRSRMRSEMRVHSELPLCFGSLLVANLILYSLDAGQSLNVGTI
jgi:hypothetical protein